MRYFFWGSLVCFTTCVSHGVVSVHCCLMVTCWERADLLTLAGDVYCIFVTFPCGILGQVWYLVVSFPDLCRLSYFNMLVSFGTTNKVKSKRVVSCLLWDVVSGVSLIHFAMYFPTVAPVWSNTMLTKRDYKSALPDVNRTYLNTEHIVWRNSVDIMQIVSSVLN